MNIIYIVNAEYSLSSGVSSKIIDQVECWRSQGHNVELYWLTKAALPESIGRFYDKSLGVSSSKRLWNDVLHSDCDVIYLRFELFKPWMIPVLRRYPVIVEVNGRIGQQYWKAAKFLKSPKVFLQFCYYLATKRIFFRRVAAIVAVTHELFSLNKLDKLKCLLCAIPNSINMSRVKLKGSLGDSTVGKPVVAGCFSTNGPYEGVNDFIKFARQCVNDLNFILMAPDVEIDFLPPNVEYRGLVNEKECIEILGQCDVGIGPVGCHRGGFTVASPLKVRLYLACGLPVILPFEDEMFREVAELPDWVLQFPSQEDSLIMRRIAILEFCRSWKGRRLSTQQVGKFVDVREIESRRLAIIKSVVQCNRSI